MVAGLASPPASLRSLACASAHLARLGRVGAFPASAQHRPLGAMSAALAPHSAKGEGLLGFQLAGVLPHVKIGAAAGWAAVKQAFGPAWNGGGTHGPFLSIIDRRDSRTAARLTRDKRDHKSRSSTVSAGTVPPAPEPPPPLAAGGPGSATGAGVTAPTCGASGSLSPPVYPPQQEQRISLDNGGLLTGFESHPLRLTSHQPLGWWLVKWPWWESNPRGRAAAIRGFGSEATFPQGAARGHPTLSAEKGSDRKVAPFFNGRGGVRPARISGQATLHPRLSNQQPQSKL